MLNIPSSRMINIKIDCNLVKIVMMINGMGPFKEYVSALKN
jgi:hypothetical protein